MPAGSEAVIPTFARLPDRLRQLDLHLFGEDPAAPRTDTRGAGDGVATEAKFTNEEDQQR